MRIASFPAGAILSRARLRKTLAFGDGASMKLRRLSHTPTRITSPLTTMRRAFLSPAPFTLVPLRLPVSSHKRMGPLR